MFQKIKKMFSVQDKRAVQQQRVFDALQQDNTTTLTKEDRRKLEKAAQITVEKYGPIIERLSKE